MEATQVVTSRGEPLKETRQHRLAGHPRDVQQHRHQRAASQIGDVGELVRLTEQTMPEGQRLFQRQELVVGGRQWLWQGGGQRFAPIQRTQSDPELGAARVRGKLLLREADGDCFAVGFELKCPSHHLVIRVSAPRLCCFHLPPINSSRWLLFNYIVPGKRLGRHVRTWWQMMSWLSGRLWPEQR